jgi:hypothetical protein
MNTQTEKRDRLVEMIGEALLEIQQEIEKAKKGEESLDGIQQLMFIKAKLEEMRQILGREDWHSYPKTKPGIARLVVDTWPIRNPLGDMLCQIEYEYLRLK